MKLVHELKQLPSKVVRRILPLLGLGQAELSTVENALALEYIDDKSNQQGDELPAKFNWFEELIDESPLFIRFQLKDMDLNYQDKLEIRFVLLWMAGKIIPEKKTITHQQLLMILAVIKFQIPS